MDRSRSVTSVDGSEAYPQSTFTRRGHIILSLVLPLLLIALILTADAMEGPKTAFVGILVSVPLLSAVFGTPRAVALVAIVTWLSALGFGLAASDGHSPAQYVRLGIIAVVGVVAVAAAIKRQDIEHSLLRAQEGAAAAAAAEREANTDWLTGLLNRRGLHAEYERRVAHGGSVVMLDLDGLKSINDTYGHQAGDDLLRAVAGRIRGCTSGADAVGRWGGDEFVVLADLHGCDPELISGRIAGAVSREPVHVAAASIPVTVSGGVAQFTPGTSFERVLEHADTQMYRQKQGVSGDATESE